MCIFFNILIEICIVYLFEYLISLINRGSLNSEENETALFELKSSIFKNNLMIIIYIKAELTIFF